MSTTTTNPNEQYYNRFDNNNNNNDDTTMINKSNIGSRSGWLYPIKGIMYLLLSFQSSPPKSTNNINIYRSIVINQICWIILPTLGLIMILFNHTFKQQLAIISSLGQNNETQWFDIVFASVSILIQATIIILRLMQFIVKKNATRIFVQVLKQQNYWNYDTMIEPDYSPCSNCFSCVCSYTGNCRGISSWIICILVVFPLLIFVNPIVATIAYAMFNAPFAAWDYLDYYFNINPLLDNNIQRSMLLYGNNEANKNQTTTTITDDHNNIDDDNHNSQRRCCCCCYIPSNKSILYRYNYCTNPYSQFGFICSLLEIIPLLGPSIFVLTNAVGTALFVIQMLPNPNNPNNDNNIQQLEMV